MDLLTEIKSELAGLAIVSKLKYLANKFENKIVFSTSFGWEDQVITHLIFSNDIPIKVFTLETGRLFLETYYVWNRTLADNKLWITGLRAEQSPNREDMHDLEWDEGNQLLKFHPIFNWTLANVQTYIKENNIVYNSLHDKGFPSIGCAPCTRAVQPGEDFRAGRWWWEDQSKKECGLHTK